MGGWGGERDCRGRGSLGSGATRTWPPPWPLLGLPPPVGQRSRTGSDRQKPRPRFKTHRLEEKEGGGFLTSLVLASPFSEWFSSFASASAFSFAFLVFLSSFLSFTAFSFYRGEERTPWATASWRRTVPLGAGGGSLTFAAFLAFGSGLGWGGFYDNSRKESSNCRT